MKSPTNLEPPLRRLKDYLLQSGWLKIEHPNRRLDLFESSPDETGDFGSISLPSSAEMLDARALIENSIKILSDVQKIDPSKLRRDLYGNAGDAIRARLFKPSGHENSLPLRVATEVLTGLKDLLSYSAYTQSIPKPYFDRVGPVGGQFVNSCVFAHTFEGSFGISIECPFTETQEFPTLDLPSTPPQARSALERLAKGFIDLREALQTDSIDPIVDDYEKGFNANICRKLADVYEAADGRNIEYDFLWSFTLKSKLENHWKPITFTDRAYHMSLSAAKTLDKAEVFPLTTIFGRIVSLRSEKPPTQTDEIFSERYITMQWEREKGQIPNIRINLSHQEYSAACDAHKDGRRISVTGVPEKNGPFWKLRTPSKFTVI